MLRTRNGYKKSETHFAFRFLVRFLADSNRRTRFCRPLTKPLIQGTIKKVLLLRLSTKGGNRTRTILLSLDFESSASTNSATLAFGGANIHNSFIFHNIPQKL